MELHSLFNDSAHKPHIFTPAQIQAVEVATYQRLYKGKLAPFIKCAIRGKEFRLTSYCNATGAPIGLWTNGEKISFYQRKDPNYFEDIPDIPHANQKFKGILRERRTIDNLIAEDKLLRENKTLADLICELEDEVLANAGVDVFEEVFKLIYTKLFDEMLGGRDKYVRPHAQP